MILKLISSLEKCFLDEDIAVKPEYTKGSCFKNEIYRFSCCYTSKVLCDTRRTAIISIESPIKEYISARKVESIGVQLPVCRENCDDDYLRKIPGLYPDLLVPVPADNRLLLTNVLRQLYFEVDTKGEVEAGTYPIKLVFTNADSGEELASAEFTLEIINALLPEQELKVTQWFHSDCLMTHYKTKAFDEEHWRILENFIRTAYKNGINMIMTPVFTLPLDTYIGGERPTTQLVGITLDENGYTFNFDKLGRWIDLCKEIGIKYFEIPHFFTQWGAECTPKIMATVDGEYKRIFGWETDSMGEEYTKYLRAFLTAFLAHMRARGDDKRCYFHISDEPNKLHLDRYRAVKAGIADLLEGYPIMDALSNFEFYQDGLVELPIPSNDHVTPFIEAGVTGLWTYYCCAQEKGVSNRFVAMPLWRTRSIGLQLYKFNIVGFLHWGYNFYNASLSKGAVNPYLDTCANYSFPAGDAFSVYPAQNGEALESIRILSFYEALQDVRAFRLAETLCGRERVIEELERIFGEEIRFDRCAKSAEPLLQIRETINKMIAENI